MYLESYAGGQEALQFQLNQARSLLEHSIGLSVLGANSIYNQECLYGK